MSTATKKKAGAGLSMTVGSALKPPAPEPTATPTVEQDQLKPISINFRLQPGDWKTLKGISIAERVSLQELLEDGINAILKQRGLQPIQGMPRGKGK